MVMHRRMHMHAHVHMHVRAHGREHARTRARVHTEIPEAVMRADCMVALLGELEREPVYADLEAFVAAQPGTGSLLEKLQREFDFNYQSLKEKPPSPPPT